MRVQTGDGDLLYLLSSERPHCTAGQNQPKLVSRAKECHCGHSLHSDFSSCRRMQERPVFCMAPLTSRLWASGGQGPGLKLSTLHNAEHP